MIKLIYLQFCSMELRVLKLKLKFPMVVFYVLHIFWNTFAKVLKIRSSLCGLLFFFGIFIYLFIFFARVAVLFVLLTEWMFIREYEQMLGGSK